MLKTTRWRPDTCECVIDYQWETDPPPQGRKDLHPSACSPCGVHKGTSLAELWTIVCEENDRKNIAVTEASGNKAEIIDQIVWQFDDARELRLIVPDDIRATAQAACATMARVKVL